MIKAYFFDMDGTLIDSEPIWCEAYQWAMGQRGIDISLTEASAIETGRSFYEIYELIKGQWPEAFASREEMGRMTSGYFEEVVRHRQIGVESSLALFRRLGQLGMPLYVVSGSVRERVRKNLDSCGVLDYVTDIVSSDDYQEGKPHPASYLTAIARSGLRPCECVAFEDALTGVISAKAAGCWCVALNRLNAPDYGGRRLADLTMTSLEDFSPELLSGEAPVPMERHRVALGLGGNLGDTKRLFLEAQRQLEQQGLVGVQKSSLHVTAPVDCVPGTPDFLNGALVGTWHGTPEELLDVTQAIERQLGRPSRHSSHESRTIDLDVLLVDDLTLATPRLTVPHPRLTQRRFALAPLAELAPEWLIPEAGMTVGEALGNLA